MKRLFFVVTVVAILAFAIPSFADEIVFFDLSGTGVLKNQSGSILTTVNSAPSGANTIFTGANFPIQSIVVDSNTINLTDGTNTFALASFNFTSTSAGDLGTNNGSLTIFGQLAGSTNPDTTLLTLDLSNFVGGKIPGDGWAWMLNSGTSPGPITGVTITYLNPTFAAAIGLSNEAAAIDAINGHIALTAGRYPSTSTDIPVDVPEPVSLAMLGPGLLFGAGFLRRKR